VPNKLVDYATPDGRKYKSELPLEAPLSHASRGVRWGPPDLSPLGLPPQIAVRLHNELFARNLFTYRDVRANMNEVVSAVMHTFAVDAQMIASIYYQREGGKIDNG
jgi:hypothetical protein